MMALTDEQLEKAFSDIKSLTTKARAHAGLAKGAYNKSHTKWDTEDQVSGLALVSISESLAGLLTLAILVVEEGHDG